MRFLVSKRRHTPAVIIVALIDVLIVLLIFLMVTTTFKQQQSLRLRLPESAQAQKAGANETPPVVVSIDAAGVFYVDKTARTYDQVQALLRTEAGKNPELVLAINADDKAPWGQVVKLRDAAAAAGIKSLVAFTKETKP
jgi:biopolymer transport protein ExbD